MLLVTVLYKHTTLTGSLILTLGGKLSGNCGLDALDWNENEVKYDCLNCRSDEDLTMRILRKRIFREREQTPRGSYTASVKLLGAQFCFSPYRHTNRSVELLWM